MQVQNFIDGAFSGTSQVLDNVAPGTGEVYGTIPRSRAPEVDRAMAAAKRAFPGWSSTTVADRAACLDKLADAVQRHAATLAEAEAKDNGKPVSLASHVDIPRAEKNLRFYASGIQHYASQSHAMDGEAINYTLRKPLGGGGLHQPLELASVLVHVEGGASLGGWQLRGGQTLGAHPCHGLPPQHLD